MRLRRFVNALTVLRTPALLAAAAVAVSLDVRPAAASDAHVTLELSRSVARYGSTVTLAGAVVPAARVPVEVLDAASRVVAAGQSREDGTYALRVAASEPGSFVARTPAAISAPATLRIEPLLRARLRGARFVGSRIEVTGRLTPARAGSLRVGTRGRARRVGVDARGRFRTFVTARFAGRLPVTVRLRPATGYVAVRRIRRTRTAAPLLRSGSWGPAVRFVEQRLRELRYALPRVDARFGHDTVEAVWAFQKVEGLPLDGVVSRAVWRRLAVAETPRAAAPRGDHIEVDKGRQLLYEVRDGRVVQIVHVSTGATGNTPLGRWRVYAKSPSFNAVGMYFSLFFLRGFAIHGYRSVPPFPASHGCVRLPLWFAPGFYARWPAGSLIWIFATTARRATTAYY